MAKQDRAVRTRKAILEAAARVFEEHGYEASKITDIVKIAQVTKGALYFHFDSKEDLAQAVMDAQVLLTPTHTPQILKAQEFVDVGMVFSHRLTHDPIMRGSARLTLEQTRTELARGGPYQGWIEINASILREAKDRGELLPHVNPTATARLVVGAYAGLNLMCNALRSGSDLDCEVSELYCHVMPSVTVPAVMALLDTRPGRGARVLAAAEADGSEPAADDAPCGCRPEAASQLPASTQRNAAAMTPRVPPFG
ncbi:TetR/AcrR family transcriptional regulator [Streptomyces sp. A3M-1-3]|uniref:ScbR family autoregulator-binding transcription factor n=1 Tax=Streptomyces sp. A3M-1-3 TaxID=2962044 RepID=UPI0020B66553|nr:ScbR family autoregulator-binding transcription factor [Streptomyces sp. A3M-1-3]MCP3822821.1 TetR/AcrR family transcriptional regulator [Streptomyces sp. A3M-1-3]